MPRYLSFLVFWSGLVTLGSELSASRLVAPYFGSSLPVWSSLIGLILVSLAVGYRVGGAWADRRPRTETLLGIAVASGLAVALVPLVSRPVLLLALKAFGHLDMGLLLGSFFGVVVLLAGPMVLLGCMTPFAVRLSTHRVEEAGAVAGRLFFWSTLGSFVGAFLPVMFLIPSWGTRRTFLFLGLSLVGCAAVGFLALARKPRAGVAAFLVLLLGGLAGYPATAGPVKPGHHLVKEAESIYHYLRVETNEFGTTFLRMNEGLVTHSRYHPEMVFTGGEWDYFALAPLFLESWPPPEHLRWALVGLGGGTAARIINEVYGADPIDGVELDPEVVRLGRTYFGMNWTNLAVTVADGRSWLARTTNRYDVVGIDAYRQPYIPFELTTVECFQQVRALLKDGGVAMINVGRTATDLRLVDSLARTMSQVFPAVYLVDLPHRRNSIVFGCTVPPEEAALKQRFAEPGHPLLRIVARSARPTLRRATGAGLVLTDDHAPVERLMDLLVAREMMREM